EIGFATLFQGRCDPVWNDASLRKIRVVLLLHVGEREARLRAVGAAARVGGAGRRVQRDAEPDHVAQVLPFEEQLAAPLVVERRLYGVTVSAREHALAAPRAKIGDDAVRPDEVPGCEVRFGDDQPRFVPRGEPDRARRLWVLELLVQRNL